LKESLSVVVPCYFSEATLPALIERLEPVLRAQSDRFEAVLVNDGSRDRTWEAIRELAERHPWVRGINLMRNYGQHNALLCGIRAASGELIVTLDDDLQNPPEEIPALLAKLREGFDVVYGTQERGRYHPLRGIATWLTKLVLQGAMGVENARSVSAYRVFKAQLREAFLNYSGSFVSIDVLLTWGTTRFASVRVRHDSRKVGRSRYTFRKLFTHALDLMTGFSVIPLQFASLLGFLCTLFGMGVLGYVLSRYFLYGSAVKGFTFLASIVAIFSGAQLLALGIIGEYLSRMHFRMMDKPSYATRETVGKGL